jgi:hypothetical protein
MPTYVLNFRLRPMAVRKAARSRKRSVARKSAAKRTARKAAKRPAKRSGRKAPRRAARRPARRAKKAKPRCGALTSGGTRCHNHAAGTSKYCGAHKGYTAAKRKAARKTGAKKARAIRTVRARAKKGKGGTGPIRNRPAAVAVMGTKKLCAATTASGGPCKNSPRTGSKYCARHKGGGKKR